MRHRIAVGVAAAAALAGGAAGRAEEGAGARRVEARSKIARVVVYPDRAQVTRVAEVELVAGGQDVVFSDLPTSLVDNSEQAQLAGGGESKVTGMETRRRFTEKPKDEAVVRLQEEIQKLQDRQKEFEDAVAVVDQKEKFVGGLRAAYSEKMSAELMAAKIDADGIASVLKLLEGTFTDGLAKRREVAAARRDLDARLRKLQSEMERLHAASQEREYKAVVVGVEAKAAGKAALELAYVVPGATWRPVYDARLDSGKREIEFLYRGVVANSTGEAWEDVELVLSTARPALAGRPPELLPIAVNFRQLEMLQLAQQAGGKDNSNSQYAVLGQRVASRTADNEPLPGGSPAPPAEARLGEAVAAAEAGATAVFFRVKKRETIPSDGQPHKTMVAAKVFAAELDYEVLPQLVQNAYLRAAIVNGDLPILGGEINVFVDGGFVGTSFVRHVAPTQKFPLYLGVDEGIRVERKAVRQEEGQEGGFLSSTRTRKTFGYVTKVDNFRKEPVRVTLKERTPVSQQEDIEVRLERATSGDHTTAETEPGILTWTFEVKPREKKEIAVEYSVLYPPGKVGGQQMYFQEAPAASLMKK